MQETEILMRRRFTALYVEWSEDADTDAISALLRQYGARMIGIDEETDRKKPAGLLFRHDNTVFRFYMDRHAPVHELLSAVAMHPGVDSVSEIVKSQILSAGSAYGKTEETGKHEHQFSKKSRRTVSMVIDSFFRGIIMAVWRNSYIKDRPNIAENRREIHDGQYGNALSGRTPQDTYLKL